MLVVEDLDTGEIRRFLVIDASVNMGEIKIGDNIRTFGPERLLAFTDRIENRIFDYVGSYSSAYRYIPRRTYEYLKKPPILGRIYSTMSDSADNGWLIDYYISRPLFNIGNTTLPKSQRHANAKLNYQWSMMSPYSHRLYLMQDMRMGMVTEQGWAITINVDEIEQIMNGGERLQLINQIQSKAPIILILESKDDLDSLLKWKISLKEGGLPAPNLFIALKNHRKWGDNINKIVDIPDCRILTAGSTISSLSSLIKSLKNKHGNGWSKFIVFASGYPNTSVGDSISEIISYLLSRRLNANPVDIEKILGGNILRELPIRPGSFHYVENDSAIVAEYSLGDSALNEVLRVLQILASRNIKHITSCDYLILSDDENIDLNSMVMTLSDSKSNSMITISLHQEKNGTLSITGWRRTFTNALIARTSEVLTTLIKATALSGDVYNSPTHLSAFTQEFLRILLVKEAKDITSALHFRSTTAEIERNLMQMCSEDIHATGLGENDVAIALAADTGQWYAGRIMESDKCEKKSIKISEKDGLAFDLIDKQVDLVKYTGALESLENAIFAVEANPLRSGFEIISYLHIKKREIQEFMKGLYVGGNTSIRLHEVDPNLVCSFKISKPEIKMGKIGTLDGKILLKPAQVFRDFNLIICISIGNNSSNSTIPILNKNSVLESLEGIENIVPEIGEYIQSLNSELTIQQCAIINCLLAIELFMLNRTEGKFALVQNGRHLSKFTIQKRNEIQNYVEFENDMKSEEVLASLIFHLIDTSSESFDKANELDAYRAIAEFLEDFGAERPTLILLLTDGGVEFSNNLQGYLGAIKEHSRYELDILGLGNQFNPLDYKKIHENMRCRIYPVNELHHIQFQGYLVSSIESLIPSSMEKKKYS